MTKQTKKALLIGVPLLLGGYIVFSQVKKQTKTAVQADDKKDAGEPFENYKVVTQKDNLNVRREPTTLSSMVDSLKKGTIIKARPSKAKGWFEYSKDGVVRFGYVSGQFLQKV